MSKYKFEAPESWVEFDSNVGSWVKYLDDLGRESLDDTDLDEERPKLVVVPEDGGVNYYQEGADYPSGHVTEDDVQEWATEMGFDAEDVESNMTDMSLQLAMEVCES